MLSIGCLKENNDHDFRVSLTPETSKKLIKKNINVYVEEDCGIKSGFSNDDYSTVGVEILKTQESLIDKSDILLSINPLDINFNNISKNATSKIFIGNFNFNNLVPDKRFTFLALEKIPRIARAQSMDILSSQASIAGYQASLLAANHLNKYFPMLITAAGTISPAKILVVGAGVAGLQAIATCNRLGAKVTGFDVRESTKEQVESVGGKFLQLDYEYNDSDEQGYAKEQSDEIQKKQNELLSKYIENSDCVITTAAIPGKQAPKIVTNENVQNMNPGSVIIDLAGETGGNCELGKYGDIEIHNGVIIDKPKNITNLVAEHSSLVFSRNVESFLNLIIKEDKVNLDLNDEIIKFTNLNLGLQMNNELYLIIIFVMAMMLGYELIKKIPPTLHTPLMSGTNAISGIVIIGSILVITSTSDFIVNILGFISLLLSSINVFGGFIVTDRMLEMFKKPKNKDKK